jgi:hypothetical protein
MLISEDRGSYLFSVTPLFLNYMFTADWIALSSSVPPVMSFTSHSPPTAWSMQGLLSLPQYTFTLKMATKMFVETLENLQHSTRRIPESRSYTLMFIL